MDDTSKKRDEVRQRSRNALLQCDIFYDGSIRSVFTGRDLEEYRHQVPDTGRTPELRVDQVLGFLEKTFRRGEPVLALFLEKLAQRKPEGDDLRTCLKELAQEVRTTFIGPIGQSLQPVPTSIASLDTQAREKYLSKFIEEHDRLPKWHRVEDSPSISFSDLFFIQPDLTTWSNYTNMENLPDRNPQQVEEITDLDPRQQFPPDRLTYDDLLNKVLCEKAVHWVITGEPGMGKTTLLKMLGVRVAKDALEDMGDMYEYVQLPVFIELGKYARELQHTSGATRLTDLYEYISGLLRESFSAMTADEVRKSLENGKYLLLFDALDEVGNPVLRSQVMSSINAFLRRYTACTIIITSRSAIYDQYEMECVAKELLPLTQKQIETYIQRGLGEERTNRASLLIEKLRTNARLHRMLSNPMLLFMMVSKLKSRLTHDNITIPEQRVALYMDFVEYLIEVRPHGRHMHDSSYRASAGSSQVEKYLTYIGSMMHTWGVWYADKINVLDVMKKANLSLSSEDQAREHLEYLVEEIGLLQEIDRSEYTFSHFTFQEFFTGEYLVAYNMEQVLTIIDDYTKVPYPLTDPWWHEVIVIYFTISKKRGKGGNDWLLRKLLEEEDTIFATRLLLAVDCLLTENANYTDGHPLYRKIHRRLTEIYYHDRYRILQTRVFQAICELGGRALLHFLRQELGQNDEERCTRAIKTLRQLNSHKREAFQWIVSRYDDGEGYTVNVMGAAVDALIALDKEKAKYTIMRWLEGKSTLAQSIVVSQMVAMDQADHIEVLLDYVTDPDTPDAMKKIIKEKLGNISYTNPAFPQVVGLFREWLQMAQSNVQRVNLLNSINFRADVYLKEYVRSLLDAQEPDLVEVAVSFLGKQQDTVSIDKLVDLFPRFKCQETLLEKIVQALGQMYHPEAEFYLSEYLEEYPSVSLWKQRVNTLGDYGDAESFTMLVDLLQTHTFTMLNHYEIKTAIIRALYKISERQLLLQKVIELKDAPALCQRILDHLQTMGSESKRIAEAAVFLLFQFAQKEHIKSLLLLAQEQSPIGDALISHLSKLSYRERLQELVNDKQLEELFDKFLKHYKADREEDAETAEVYLRVQLLKGQESLNEALTASSPSECLAAIKIAREKFDQNDEDLLPALLELLSSPDSLVVKGVIQLLGDFAGQEAVAPLLRIFYTRPDYQQEAFSALFVIAQRERLLGITSFTRRHNDAWER